jgi:hypothetical protein
VVCVKPSDHFGSQLFRRGQQIIRVFFAYDANALIHGLASLPRAALDVIGGPGPLVTQGVAERVDAALVMPFSLAYPETRCVEWDHTQLQRGIVGVLKATIRTEPLGLGIGEAPIHNAKQLLDFGDRRLTPLEPSVATPLL